jgi:hypothetical protein
MSSPREEYQQRLEGRRSEAARLAGIDLRYSQLRLVVFVGGFVALIVWWRGAVGPWWLGLARLAFVILIRVHDGVIRKRLTTERAIEFYERGIARIEDRWNGAGETGERFRNDQHPYANDLDLFGQGSLFQLLSIARTRAGEERLASWLIRVAPLAEVRLRQEAVAELTPALDLREELSMAGSEVRAGVNSEALVAWAQGTPLLRREWLRVVAGLLTASAVAAAAYAVATGEQAPLVTVLVLEFAFFFPQRARVLQSLHAAGSPARDLDILAHALDRLERRDFQAARLASLRRSLDTGDIPASVAIRRLHRLVELHDWQHNLFFAPIASALLWGTHMAWAIERWRRLHGSKVHTWLHTVGDFEALSSLSAYRYEHPDDVWPEIREKGAGFDGVALGHPLIPAARAVRNDVHLWGGTQMLLVSGSNMSGKSTFLRTVGINAALALAGAPVRAASLRITPLEIGATLRIQDSLQEGRSRFYAEITRVREITDIARGPVPLLFLLDELFHGTNSHDRLAGASGVLKSLLDRGAIGLVTTHDLALTAIVDSLAPRAMNVHFEDQFEGGDLHFDYRVKDGPVTRSNAIALMRAVGLNVEGPTH